jgi:hypothetical protein
MSKLEERCYVVSGIGFLPLKIKGHSNKKALIESLKKKGFSPIYSQLNPNSKSGKACTTTPTPY